MVIPRRHFSRLRQSSGAHQLNPAQAFRIRIVKYPCGTLPQARNGIPLRKWGIKTTAIPGPVVAQFTGSAISAQIELGMNVPEDAVYPFNFGDETGKPLDG